MIHRLIANLKTGATTYRTGLLQAKAYRLLKQTTSQALRKYHISTLDWAMLGLLYDHPKGLRFNVVAKTLSVEAAFVTALAEELVTKKLLIITPDPQDRRAKVITLTAHARALVPEIEKVLRQSVKGLLSGIQRRSLLTYLDVLARIVDNAESSSR